MQPITDVPATPAAGSVASRPASGSRRRLAVVALGGLLLLGVSACVLRVARTSWLYEPLDPASLGTGAAPTASPGAAGKRGAGTPRGRYVVIDRTNNRLWVRRGDEVLLAAICSAGSGRVLDDPAGGRQWIFDTPTGVFRVRGKISNPVWRRPDWAFIEEGRSVPTDPGERFEYGQLGEYALDLGDGYLIHGTLYERLLGRGVTHGCVRLGRDDLRALVRLAPVGTPVYIF